MTRLERAMILALKPTSAFRIMAPAPVVNINRKAVDMILHYVFIGIYLAAIFGIILAVIHFSRQRDGSSHRQGH
jgi:hypothetical protein